jgi:hypothetical protein
LLGGPSIKLPSGRWQQGNAFHHGDARWGINQLDDRAVEPYPPGTIIPNPARRRLDQSLRLARATEGDARRKLACTTPELGALRRAVVEQDLADALKLQQDLEALRPQIPTHAPIEETVLSGKLVRHTGQLKRIVDVIRVVCANAESELATLIAPHMGRPREAKKVIANIIAAPGKVTVTDQAIHVRLAPAANRSERDIDIDSTNRSHEQQTLLIVFINRRNNMNDRIRCGIVGAMLLVGASIIWNAGCQNEPEMPGDTEITNSASSTTIMIDATRVTRTVLISSCGGVFDSTVIQSISTPPGSCVLETATGGVIGSFTVTPAGIIDYDRSLDVGVFSGRGTSTLSVVPHAIAIEATGLTRTNLVFAGVTSLPSFDSRAIQRVLAATVREGTIGSA